MEYLLNQRLSSKSKDAKWGKKMMDHYIEQSFAWSDEWERIEDNYALKNNQLPREEIARICQGLGSDGNMEVFINAYNKTHNIIDAHKGEEWNRPFSFSIVNNSKKAVDRIDRDKRRELDKLADSIFKHELDKQTELFNIEQQRITGQMDEEQGKRAMEEVQNRYNKLYGQITDPKTIYDKYDNITTAEELAMQRLMRMIVERLNIKFIKNQTFEDAIVAGREMIEIYSMHEYDLPKIRQLNPLNVFFQKSPDTQWLQDADFVGYHELLTLTDCIETYGEFIEDSDYKKLTESGPYFSGVRGLDTPFTAGPNNPNPSIDKQVRGFKNLPRHNGLTAEQYVLQDPVFGGPDNGWMGVDYVNRLGLSATDTRQHRLREYVDVYTVYWKSQRKIGKYGFINEYGEPDETFVDESFIIPKGANKETITSGYTKNKVIYRWSDKTNPEMKYSLEWIWIPEVWKGIRIGQDIYCQIGPVKHAYQSLLNPYEVKLPIYGYIYNNRNAYSISLMDRMKPWQKLYYVIMARLLKLISQDRGVWTFMNIQMLDKNLGFEEALRVAEDNGVIPYNPLSNSKGAGNFGNMNTMKVAERIDATNSQAIQHYITLLQFIEENIKLSSGMSDQRLAQTNPRMTATDNYRDTMHSINITEPLHAAHDLLWQEILQGMMEMTLSVLGESSGKIRGFLSDEEKVMIDLNMLSLEDNFRLRVADNSKAYRVLEQAKQLSHALLQNDKVSLDTLVELLETENLTEFKYLVRKAEEDFAERQSEQQQSQQEHEKEIMELKRKQSEDEQIATLDQIYLKGKLDYEREKMRSSMQAISFDTEKDYNHDGIPDYLQWEQLRQKVANDSRRLDIEEMKTALDAKKTEQEINDKNIDRAREDNKHNLDREQEEKKEALKNKIEQAKLKIMKNKTNK
jgi:hypothetical protein